MTSENIEFGLEGKYQRGDTIGDRGVNLIMEVFPHLLQNLKYLILSSHNLTHESMKTLKKIKNMQLKELDISIINM